MAKLVVITYTKERKIGLPNYSNITVGMSIEIDWSQTDEPAQHQLAWDQIDAELDRQVEIEKARFEIFDKDAVNKPDAKPLQPTPTTQPTPAVQPSKPSPYQALSKGKMGATEHGKLFKPGS